MPGRPIYIPSPMLVGGERQTVWSARDAGGIFDGALVRLDYARPMVESRSGGGAAGRRAGGALSVERERGI
jgi:hypothetical protein